MFDAQCDLAALVYDDHDDPDAILRDFASDLNVSGSASSAWCRPADAPIRACRPCWCIAANRAAGAAPSAGATGCKLDLARLQDAGARVAGALATGADLVIINRFGKRERDGKASAS